MKRNDMRQRERANRALLYDLQLGSFTRAANAESHRDAVREGLQNNDLRELAPLVTMTEPGRLRRERVILKVQTIAKYADWLVDYLKSNNISDAFKVPTEVPYNPNRHDNIFSWLLQEEQLPDVVVNYTTAYTNREISGTRDSLLTIARNLGVTPRSHTFIPVPVRWLKKPYRFGGVEGTDFHIVKMQAPYRNLIRIASAYVKSDYTNKIEELMWYNDIERGQETQIWAEAPILIPTDIYVEPLEVVVVEESSPEVLQPPSEPIAASTDFPPDPFMPYFHTEFNPGPSESSFGPGIRNAKIDAQPIQVLRNKVPAVLIESFNIGNKNDLFHYLEDEKLDRLTEAYAVGIQQMVQEEEVMRNVNTVIIDWGHGSGESGTKDNKYGTGTDERYFTNIIQNKLKEKLEREGFTVYPLRYTQEASQRRRINYYIDEANKIADRHGVNRTVYISNHVNFAKGNAEPPRAFVDRNVASQPKSSILGKYLLMYSVPFYMDNIHR
ncbi:N-acetylmuramoyl-L-alanine amidase [Nanoarchaeota archaeon]